VWLLLQQTGGAAFAPLRTDPGAASPRPRALTFATTMRIRPILRLPLQLQPRAASR
jgi:hypothetical protein